MQEAWNIFSKIMDDYSYDSIMKHRMLAIEECYYSNNTTFETEVLLSDESCKSLIDYTNRYINDKRLDTVDGLPEWQITYLQKDIEKLCTISEIRNIIKIAYDKYPNISNVEFFVRKYGVGAREKLPWHSDMTVVSSTIHLSNYFEYDGGDFVFIEDAEIKRSSELKKGCGFFHNGNVIHKVESTTTGNRWSLIVFFFADHSEWSKEENKVIF
jgi:hypothetical protein